MTLTFPILWLFLAAAVTFVAILRRPAWTLAEERNIRAKESDKALALLLVVSIAVAIYGVALIAGFIYISKFLVSGLTF